MGVLDQTDATTADQKVLSAPSLNTFIAALGGLGVGIASLVAGIIKASSSSAIKTGPQAAVIDGAFLLAAVGILAAAWILAADFKVRANVKMNAVNAKEGASVQQLWVRLRNNAEWYQVLAFRGNGASARYLISENSGVAPTWKEAADFDRWRQANTIPIG